MGTTNKSRLMCYLIGLINGVVIGIILVVGVT